MARKKRLSKVGTVIKVKGYERKVGNLPPRTKAGRFSKRGGGKSGTNQGRLF